MKKTKTSLSKFRWPLLAALAVVVLLITPVAITYSSFSVKLLDNQMVYVVDNLFAQIPAIPKTARQVLVRTSVVNQTLDSYKIKSELKIGNGQLKLVDVQSSGAVTNLDEEQSQSQVRTAGQILFPVQEDFDFETNTQGQNFYFKVNNGVNLGSVNTSSLEGWYKLDLSEIEKDLKVDIRSEQDIVGDINKQLKSYLDKIADQQNIDLKQISKDGQDYYQVSTTLDANPLHESFLPGVKDKKSKLEVLIAKESFFLAELKLSPLGQPELGLNFNYMVSDHNQDFEITAPESAKTVNNPIELFLLFTDGGAPTADNLLKALGGEVKDVATTLLTVERLTKVILLLPKAI